jgi:hypothetical protein
MSYQSPDNRWVPATLVAGGVYLVAGLALGELAGRANSVETRELWRRAAWVISAIAFGLHIAYEHFRLRAASRASALHVSAAAALATFGLAVAANLHPQPSGQRAMMAASLVIWPVMVAIPAFIVAFIGATLLRRLRPASTRSA